MDAELSRINTTSAYSYKHEGPGIGAADEAIEWARKHLGFSYGPSTGVVDIGSGKAMLLKRAKELGCGFVMGVDIAEASREAATEYGAMCIVTDVSESDIPLASDSIDIVFCTETIEHLSNPYRCVAEVKRILKHGGRFVLAFPMPEDNLGYDCGQHAHVYPGFLLKDPFEMFMRQMYFKQLARTTNGSSAWYGFANYKGDNIIDVFHVVSGNYSNTMHKDLLDKWDGVS